MTPFQSTHPFLAFSAALQTRRTRVTRLTTAATSLLVYSLLPDTSTVAEASPDLRACILKIQEHPHPPMELDADRHGFGKMGFGCKHYRRRCKIRAPCCNDVFHCRHCHNEFMKDGHELDRHAVESVICLVCDTEQPVAQVCNNCGVCMGEYFCRACKFFDDDVEKEQYHCKDCGICRVGGKENFFHCQKCGSCYSVNLRDKHCCIENSMKNNCPICYEYLFDSLRETSVLRCGHTMHLQCFHEMLKHDKFSCPICSTSIFDMDKFLRALDAEIEASILHMGKGWIVCNDCRDTTQVYSNIAGQKCCHCQSYNTCRVAPPVLP